MSDVAALVKRLRSCPVGHEGWNQFEQICVDILEFLFVPPLTKPTRQTRSYSGVDRRDAIFPNRNFQVDNNWGKLYTELGARLILFEFKNYDSADITKEEINQTRNYLTKPMGRLAVVCGTKAPAQSAHIKRNTIYNEDQKVILFITTEDLIEMLYIKERGEDPSDFIMDLLERFYMQHE